MLKVACGRCGQQAEVDDDDATPAGWTFETDRGRIVRYCTECVPEHPLDRGEAPEEYWER